MVSNSELGRHGGSGRSQRPANIGLLIGSGGQLMMMKGSAMVEGPATATH